MGERLVPKLDRLGAEAGIKQMTPEIYNFALLVRADVVAQWPERPWVGLTDEERDAITSKVIGFNSCVGWEEDYAKAIEAKLKEKNT
jgi:uncharacterized protein YeaC (DUF1315 family)